MSEQKDSPRRRPLSRTRKLGRRRRRETRPSVATTPDPRFRPELKASFRAFGKTTAVLALLILVQVLCAFLPQSPSWTTASHQPELRKVVEPTIRYVQNDQVSYLITPTLSPAQESMTELLLEQSGDRPLVLTVHPTWPEYLGYALWMCFGLGVFWFLQAWMRGDWTETYRSNFETRNALLLASLLGAYGLAAALGWVWHEPTTFGLMYLTLLSFAVFKDHIPVRRSICHG